MSQLNTHNFQIEQLVSQLSVIATEEPSKQGNGSKAEPIDLITTPQPASAKRKKEVIDLSSPLSMNGQDDVSVDMEYVKHQRTVKLRSSMASERKAAQVLCRSVMTSLHVFKLAEEVAQSKMDSSRSSSSSPPVETSTVSASLTRSKEKSMQLAKRMDRNKYLSQLTVTFEKELDRFTLASRNVERVERLLIDRMTTSAFTPPSFKTKADKSKGAGKFFSSNSKRGSTSPEEQQQQLEEQTPGGGKKGVQQQMSSVEVRQRLSEIHQIERDVLEVMEMFQEVQSLVQAQQHDIDDIEQAIKTTKLKAQSAQMELELASETMFKKRRRKLCCWSTTIVVFVSALLLFHYAN